MSAFLILALLLQTTTRDATAQRAPAAGSAIVGGLVTTGPAGASRPLRRAVVSLAGTSIDGARQAVTDETGHFAFDQLAPGRFTLTVEKPGYLKTYVGSRQPGRPPAAPIAVVDGQKLLDLAIDVPKGAVIDGTVGDEAGVPLASAQVTAQRVVWAMGERKLVSSQARPVTTDDRGHYRVFGLAPGEYVVRASDTGHGFPASILTDAEFKAAQAQIQTGRVPPPGSRVAGPELQRGFAYFPSGPDAATAQTIMLGLGEERAGIDIVNAPVPVFKIEYTGVGPAGRPIRRTQVGIASVTKQSLFTSLGGVRFDELGRGVLSGLSPGRYLFFGRGFESDEPNAPALWTEAEVDVNGADASGVTLQFLPGQRVSGKVSATGAPLAIGPGARAQLNAAPLISGTSSGTPTTTVNPDGTFTFVDVPPGRYRFELGGVTGWHPMSASYQGVDTLDVPLEVRASLDIDGLAVSVTNRMTEISGLITDAAGRPTPELAVLVFSQDRGLWTSPRRFSGATRIASDGKYRISGLPPGNYFLAVVTDIDPLQATDPMFLEQLMTGAVSIQLADGQKVVQDLKIGG